MRLDYGSISEGKAMSFSYSPEEYPYVALVCGRETSIS